MQEAIAILEAGVRMMPSDPRLRRSLAGAFLSNADPKRSFAIYKATGLKGATASEYLSAVGAGIAAHEARMADAWLKEGLLKYPGDTELLCLAGKQAAARNDFKKAEAFWRVALRDSMRTTKRLWPSASAAVQMESTISNRVILQTMWGSRC